MSQMEKNELIMKIRELYATKGGRVMNENGEVAIPHWNFDNDQRMEAIKHFTKDFRTFLDNKFYNVYSFALKRDDDSGMETYKDIATDRYTINVLEWFYDELESIFSAYKIPRTFFTPPNLPCDYSTMTETQKSEMMDPIVYLPLENIEDGDYVIQPSRYGYDDRTCYLRSTLEKMAELAMENGLENFPSPMTRSPMNIYKLGLAQKVRGVYPKKNGRKKKPKHKKSF